ncbi:MAG: hypothetical protein ACE5FO_14105 [Parvularculaceae bacterium]
MTRTQNIFASCARVVLVFAALALFISAARAHVDPKEEENLYEITVVWTSLDLKNDGDDWWRGDGDIIVNYSVEQKAHGPHGPQAGAYDYNHIPALKFDDHGGRGGEVRFDRYNPPLLFYQHRQCHQIRGDFELTFQVLDDDDGLILRGWNALVRGVRNTVIHGATRAVMRLLTSSPVGAALDTLASELARADSFAANSARDLVNDLAQRLGARGDVVRRAQDYAARAIDGILDDIPGIREARGAIRWARDKIGELRQWIEDRLEEIFTAIYNTVFGWFLAERPTTELLGEISFTETPLPDDADVVERTGSGVATLAENLPGIGQARIGYEIRQRLLRTWGGGANAACRQPPARPPRAASPPAQTVAPAPSASAPETSAPAAPPQREETLEPETAPPPRETAAAPPREEAAQPETPPAAPSPPAATPGPPSEPAPDETASPPPAGEGEAPPEETAQSEETPPETGETAAEPEKKRKPRIRFSFGITREGATPPPAPSGPVLTRSPQLSRCAETLGANTGREHRAEGVRRTTHGLAFVREDLLIYINSTEPQITDKMKDCARMLLNFLDGNSTPGDRDWIIRIYEAAYEKGRAGG